MGMCRSKPLRLRAVTIVAAEITTPMAEGAVPPDGWRPSHGKPRHSANPLCGLPITAVLALFSSESHPDVAALNADAAAWLGLGSIEFIYTKGLAEAFRRGGLIFFLISYIPFVVRYIC
jgi:hypothetical protein